MRSDESICVASPTGFADVPAGDRYGFWRVNHGCVRISSSEKRVAGSSFSIPRSSERMSAGSFRHSSSVVRPPVSTYSRNSSLHRVGSSHGVFPTSSTNSTTPHDQMSEMLAA